MVPCFFLTREYSVSSAEMVIAGGRKGTEELLEKHMNDLRFCTIPFKLIFLFTFTFFSNIQVFFLARMVSFLFLFLENKICNHRNN